MIVVQNPEKLSNPPPTANCQYSASDFAAHFVNKVDKIRASTVAVDKLTIISRPSDAFTSYVRQELGILDIGRLDIGYGTPQFK